MQDIPYDVWLHIASFLGPEEVENLLTLNSMFLSIALDTRYWMAFIGPLYRRATQRSLNRLTRVFAIIYVREADHEILEL